tara:strand:- start:1081 stop:1737 length:657 start_codon:yes stop_codon:yes gene_type:complete
MIPKIIHQLWIGPDPMPKHCVEFCKEMKDMNPEFEHKLWGNEVLKEFKDDKYLYSYLELNSGIPIAFICDRIRLLLLKKYGGIYLDVDCKPIKPFSFIFDKLTDQHCFFAGMKRTQNHHTLIDCAIYGATVNSRVIDDCLSTYEDLNFANGGHLFNNKIIETMEPDIALFGYEYFYNWEVTDKTVLLHDIADTRLFSWVPEDKLPPERRKKRNNKIVK